MELAPLPFAYDDLEPFLSRQTLLLHYSRHHRRYYEKLQATIQGTRFSLMSLEDIVLSADGEIFRYAAQVWNHDFYWQCLSPRGSCNPCVELLLAIEKYFDCFDEFKNEFKRQASNNYGSGWTWLVRAFDGELRIVNTLNAETPLVDVNTVPLLTIDVWEHAYHFDYQGDREDYIEKFWCYVNWKFVNKNFNNL